MRELLTNSGRFILLIVAQILVFNNIALSGYVNPFVYVLFTMSLPREMHQSLVLILSFFMGICLDIFMVTPGLNTAALTFVAYIRPFIFRVLSPRDGYEFGMNPTVSDMGWGWYLLYATAMVLSLHLILFSLENFSFSGIGQVIVKSLLSTVLTVLIIVVFQLFNAKPRKQW